MDQYVAIRRIYEQLDNLSSTIADSDTRQKLESIKNELLIFSDRGIDYKEVVDQLDDSIFITDAAGTVIYTNPAYSRNTGIQPGDVMDKNISDLCGPGKLFTGGAINDVLTAKKPVFRLSTTHAHGKPLLGYVVGTPIFNQKGELTHAVAVSRPLVKMSALKSDFSTFVQELQKLQAPGPSTVNGENSLSREMIGKDTSLANIYTLISHVAASDATVLITGESGAGKEVLADEIYKNSSRVGKPFVKVNCAAIPASLMESELFGYEKGAFSGANSKGKTGLFEMANHGTLMLDEIGDMPMDLQVKLLRAIQSQEITRIGGTTPIHLDIRFLALTNSDLKAKIANGEFRQDLYYRLNVIPIHVPPLRGRTVDIPALCNYFIDIFSKKYSRPFRLTEHQYSLLCQYQWPGNIRELENVMEYLVLCSSGIGQVQDDVICSLLNVSSEEETLSLSADGMNYSDSVAMFEKQLLERALAESSNLREAGAKLGLNASTISRKIKQLGIEYANSKS
ncbi:transcriptional regulator containing GAF, AAA-type ATPase [Clostridium sp. SY8519]|uniref:sigma-54 interaction domain-containing protein n=1 Tax=Clostridium sp. (strain SY8519) TaxID=1042156 RepID=UPI00021721E6|nr:sigma 54-interacting transcriptional regulator [Clostridium sp. SY8519]BAK47426.1 transcriptional regulator containing GAF, AAA-type ATPase [Clostridium sp. SY8519]